MKRKKVYNLFQINLIVFFSMSFLIVPVMIVIAFIFDLHFYTSTNNIVLIADITALIFFTVGLTVLLITRDKYERKLKPSYQKEFLILMVFSAVGIFGIGILYTYLGGLFFYVPHVVIPLFIGVYLLVFFVGDKYFNVNLFKK